MKKFFLLYTILLLFIINGAMAQRYSIKGKIIDEITKENLMFVNCVLYKDSDSINMYKGASADTSGNFVLKGIRKNNFNLELSFVGYEKHNLKIGIEKFKDEKVIDLGEVEMKSTGKLEGVEITAKIERIQVDEDKLTMNIDEQLAASVSSAFDLLKRVPGVFIDKDDKLTLNGKSGVMFQYNGRDLKLDYTSIVDMLKGMTPDQVEKFEVMTNPGVKYDAEGTAGIINIKIKKNQNYGVNGSIWGQTSYQTALQYYGSGRLSYVDDNWTTSIGFSPMRWASKSTNKEERYTSTHEGDTILFRTEKDDDWVWENNNFNLNANYLIDSNRTIGLSLYYTKGGNPLKENTVPYQISSYPNYFSKIDSSYINSSSYLGDRSNFGLGLDYVRKLDTLDSKISYDLSYSHSENDGNLANLNEYFLGDINTILSRREGYKRNTLSSSDDLSARVDYFKPIKKTMRFEAGAKTNFTFNDKDFYSRLLDTTSNTYLNDEMQSNHFKYYENINSLYASFSNTFKKKFNVRLGLRAEQTNTKGHQYAIDSINTRNYFDIFPNLSLNYKFKDDNQLSLSYSYRISRPWSGSLDPFISKYSEYSYSTGNPYIKPQYSHSISLSHSFKYMLFTNASYSFTQDDINWLEGPIDSNLFEHNPLALISIPTNFGSNHNLSFRISFNKEFFDWFRFSSSFGSTYMKILSSANKAQINRENWSYNGNISTDFTLPKKWNISVYYYFYSSSMYGLSSSSSSQDISLSVSKKFFNDKFGLTLSVSDLFDINENYSETRYLNTLSKSWGNYQGPRFSFSLRYSFGKYYKNKQVQKPQVENFDTRAGESKQ
ncbi:MAG: TonB-dependent receptor family protein [Bacteroidales bacterium]|nr:TonB-dependent receptor family protein [Bacteroidales bacterium]